MASKNVNEENPEVDQELILETVLGEYMSLLIEPLKAVTKPWDKISERDQNTIISNAQSAAKDKLLQMVKLVASAEHVSLKTSLSDISIKPKAIQAKAEFYLNDPKKHDLFEFANKQAILVLVDPEDYFVGEGKPEADKDQPALNGVE